MKRLPWIMTAALIILASAAGLNAADQVKALMDSGMEKSERGLYDQALKDFNQALKLKSNDPNIYDALGVVHYAKGQRDQAIKFFTRALEIDPKFAKSLTRRANVYDSMEQYDKALEDLEKAKSLGYKVDSDFINLIKKKAAKKK